MHPSTRRLVLGAHTILSPVISKRLVEWPLTPLREPDRDICAKIGSVRRLRTLIVAFCLVSATFANDALAAAPNHVASEQQVLTFIADTIDWYRHLPTAQQIGTEPTDLLFLEDNRSITTEIVRLSFEFGRTVAAIGPAENPLDTQWKSGSPGARSEWQYLSAARAKLDTNSRQAVDQLRSVIEARIRARGADREKIDTQIAEIQRRIQVLSAMSTDYQTLLGFVLNASADPERETRLGALVENLEHTVPNLSAAASSSQSLYVPADPSSAPSGIMGMISRVSVMGHKERVIDGLMERTDTLSKSSQSMRTPFTEPYRKEFSTLSLDTSSLDVLQQQQSRLTNLVAEAKTVSPAIAALIKQRTLLNLYSSRLAEWRSETQIGYRAAWSALLVRLGVLAIAITVLLGVSVGVRRLAYRHVSDPDRRQMVLIGERVLLWLIITVLVILAFAFDPGSLATFLGLFSAGLAIGLHDVLVAIGGYLLIVRKFHVRTGDRVQISGVTGEVIRLGLLEFELGELDTTGQRTGRVAFFSNSYVFVAPATPLFRQARGPSGEHPMGRNVANGTAAAPRTDPNEEGAL